MKDSFYKVCKNMMVALTLAITPKKKIKYNRKYFFFFERDETQMET